MKNYERITSYMTVGSQIVAIMPQRRERIQAYIDRLFDLEDKIERGEIDYVADKDNEIARLTAENAELRETLSKMETVEKELKARLGKAVEE